MFDLTLCCHLAVTNSNRVQGSVLILKTKTVKQGEGIASWKLYFVLHASKKSQVFISMWRHLYTVIYFRITLLNTWGSQRSVTSMQWLQRCNVTPLDRTQSYQRKHSLSSLWKHLTSWTDVVGRFGGYHAKALEDFYSEQSHPDDVGGSLPFNWKHLQFMAPKMHDIIIHQSSITLHSTCPS